MSSLRTVVFWAHFTAGIVAGSIVFLMSLTGVMLAFEKQIVDWAEASSLPITEPSGRLPLDELAAAARTASGGALINVAVRRDRSTVVFGFGPKGNVVLDASSVATHDQSAPKLRGFFHKVTDFHRWLALSGDWKELGQSITGACNAAFLFLAVTGPIIWWPKRWTPSSLRAVTVPSTSLRGWRRDWNWHNAIGFWSAPILVVITVTGLVISYPWANDLVYRLAGSEVPPRREPARAVSEEAPAVEAGPAILDAVYQAAATRAPNWQVMMLRLPRPGEKRGTALISDGSSWNPYARSTLTFDATTGEIQKWEPYADASLGRRLRTWMRGLHTGEAVGLPGQIAAALASAGAVVLAWTGIALAVRRMLGVRRSAPVAE